MALSLIAALRDLTGFYSAYLVVFLFWVGITHSGTLMSAIFYRLGVPWRASISRIAEAIVLGLEASLEVVPGDAPVDATPKPARPRKTAPPRKAASTRSPRAR